MLGSGAMKISILIPVYNEEKNVSKVIDRVHEQKLLHPNIELEIIVMNDGSTDQTHEIINKNLDKIDQYIHLTKNVGKGGAVIAGLKAAKGDYILFQDADLEYNPQDYKVLFAPLMEDSCDVIIGTRMSGAYATRVFYFWHKVGNYVLTLLFNITNNTTFTDIYSCYLLFRTSLVNPEELKYTRWEQQAEILTLAVSRGQVFYDVPVSYFGRRYEEGKKIRFYHAFSVIKAIILVKLRTLF